VRVIDDQEWEKLPRNVRLPTRAGTVTLSYTKPEQATKSRGYCGCGGWPKCVSIDEERKKRYRILVEINETNLSTN